LSTVLDRRPDVMTSSSFSK